MAIKYIKTEDLAKHQRECNCGFVIEIKPGYNICTKSLTKQQKPQAQAQKPNIIDEGETIWF